MLQFNNDNGHGVVSPGAEGLHVPPRAGVVSEVVGLLQPQAVQVEPRLVTVPAVLVRLRGNMLDVTATLVVTLSVRKGLRKLRELLAIEVNHELKCVTVM